MAGLCKKRLLILFCILLVLPFFFACNRNASRKSFNSSLDEIDALINQSQYADARRELEKLEKSAYGSWAELGIYKRYMRIGQEERAEKVLIRALKKNPKNPELTAVYTNFLLNAGKVAQALEYGKSLQGTKFGSIYSQAVLQDTLNKYDSAALSEIFLDSSYFPVYFDAYNGTHNTAWLLNAALLRLANGSYEAAAAIHPDEVFSAKDAYFWALVMYDATRFADSIEFASVAKKILEGSSALSGASLRYATVPKVSALLADAYTNAGDAYKSESVRAEFLNSLYAGNHDWLIPKNSSENAFFPIVFTNSAKWARDNSEDARCAELLTFCVNTWPDYVPALTAYTDFAYNSNLTRKETYEQMKLRDNGIATLEMERYDNRTHIPLSDALVRLDGALSRTNDPLLYIVRLNLKYKTDSSMTETERIADMWRVLEDNQTLPYVYPTEILEFAVHYFLEKNMVQEAWNLYSRYVAAKYGIPTDERFWPSLVQKVYGFTQKEVEFASYFAVVSKRADDAVRLLEYSVFESGSERPGEYISSLAGNETCINLANVYGALGNRQKALDLYTKINGRCSDVELKSLIMYRMAVLYMDAADTKNARRCAEYALSVYPQNAEAKLLLAKLKAL